MKKNLITLALITSLYACGDATNTQQTTQAASTQTTTTATLTRAQIDKIVEQYTKDFIALEPALATSIGVDSKVYGHYQDQWPDYSTAGMQKVQQTMAHAAEKLAAIDTRGLSADDRRHVEVNRIIAEYYAGDKNFPGGYIDTWGGHLPYIVNQISGPLIDIPNVLKDQHRIENKQDAQDYVKRLQGLAELTLAVEAKVLDDANKGIILPKALFPNTLKYLTNFVAIPANQHSLITAFQEKIAQLNDLTDEEKSALVNQAIQLVEQHVYPAFARVSATMKKLEAKAPTIDGIWGQPGGDEFYRHEVKYLADSLLNPEEIHQIGLNEVKRISHEMDEILQAQGMTEGSVSERMMKLNDMPEFIFEDSDEGRQALLDYLTGEIDKVMAKAPEYFATMPKYNVVVKRIPVVAQDGAAGGFYNSPALDGSRDGVFSINLKDMKAQPKFSLKTLTYHEAVPGHHFQISLNMAQTNIGLMRQNAPFNAYVEGWALYAEQVAYEMGMYEGDPWGNLGRLQAEIYRAARLVVDTGLHFKHWTRQQAIDYFAQATGTAMSDVESAIDRYMAWPGQALGYKMGMLKILELREWAKQQLGKQFDIKAFHDVVLLPGARPLTILQQDVERWVAQQKSTNTSH